MTTPPADSPPPERPIPWWRHRRRLFYLAVVIVPVATLWGGWVWWYRAGFPVPTEAQCRLIGMDLASHQAWIIEPRWKLIDWKGGRETHRLRLSGTAWRDKYTDITITFGTDGRLGVAVAPGWEERVRSTDPFSVPLTTASLNAALPFLHRTPYQFHAGESAASVSSLQPILSLPDSPWNGYLWATSRKEIDLTLKPKRGSDEGLDVHLKLTRVPAAP